VLAINPSYGHRRIAISLGIGKRRARRIMRLYGIKPYKRMARWKKRHDLRRKPAPFNNLIKYSCPLRPNIAWVSDFTYLRHRSRNLYLATLMDLYTREVVGWHVSDRHTKELILHALLDAIRNQGFRLPQVVHSDQGSEYNCRDYLRFLDYLGVRISMSNKQSPWENGHQESFYNNFKTDLGLEFDRFQTTGELIEAIHKTIHYYNHRRIHTALRMPPVQFRHKYRQAHLDKSV